MEEEVKELLRQECNFQLRSDIMNEFISKMSPIKLKRGEAIIEKGPVNPDIYVVRTGIFSYNYMNGSDERCWGFALPGTMMMSNHSYYFGQPSFYHVVACCPSEVMHCSKQDFDELVKNSHEFAQWALSMAQCQLYYTDMKNSVINGNAAERFQSLVKSRPDLLHKVPMRTIASYLGITQQYLSNLKKIYL